MLILYDRYARPVYILAAHLLDPLAKKWFRMYSWRDKAGLYQAEHGTFNTWLMSITRHLVLDKSALAVASSYQLVE
jgi:hypothetical protein